MSKPFRIRRTDWLHDAVALRAVRHEVFVLEQRVPEWLEWDALDPVCRHALAEDDETAPIGCARLLPDGHIGRVAVRATWRGRGVGSALLRDLIACARADAHPRVRLNAQEHAMPFYARFGFAPSGPPFEEAGIPHREMMLVLEA